MAGEPYWWDAAPPIHTDERIPARADVVVVGGGLTGLSAALTLSRCGLDVVVIEADGIGAGASTRNAGFVSGELRRPLSALVKRFGQPRAVEIAKEAQAAAGFLRTLIETEHIDCNLQSVSRLILACHPDHYGRLASDASLEAKLLGSNVEMIPKAELSDVAGDFYHGAKRQLNCSLVHPARLLTGLVERVRTAGAVVVTDTRVQSVRTDGKQLRIGTCSGQLAATRLVVATNGYTGEATPLLRRRLVPVDVHMIATEKITPDRISYLLPNPTACIESRRIRYFFRTSPSHDRILFGGRVSPRATHDQARIELARAMHGVFPETRDIGISHVWAGRIALTSDGSPQVIAHDGIHYVAGMNGAGIAMGPYLAHQVADTIVNGGVHSGPFVRSASTGASVLQALALKVAPVIERYHALRDRFERT